MIEPMRWGILGAAKIARTALLPAIQTARDARLVALATSDPAKTVPFRAVVPDLRVMSYDEMLADPGIDAVYVPLPNHLHVEWAERALMAGKHVLCEKPLALAASDIDRLIAARDASGRLAAEAFMVLHHPQWRRLRTLVADGVIGPLGHVEGMFTYHNTDAANIRNKPGMGGGGLLDIGVYPLVTTRFATGAEPGAIRADIRRDDNGIDHFARVWADFPGFTFSMHCGMRLQRRQDMVFHGTTGWIRMAAPFNPPSMGEAAIEIHRADGSVLIERFPGGDQYQWMVEAFGDSARGNLPFACDLEFSRGNAVAMDAIFAACP